MHNNNLEPSALEKLRAMLQRYTVITYNGNYYDLPLIYMFISGCNNQTLKEYSDRIIQEKIKPWEIERIYKDFSIDTIDLIDLCPLQSTLKIYGGRLHTKTMQDLPLPPDAVIPQEKINTIRKYCKNDTRITAELYNELSFNLQIREKLGAEIGTDLRSKGDAKIAETLIIKKIYSDRQTVRPQNIVKPGTQYNYTAPKFIKFESEQLQQIKSQFENLPLSSCSRLNLNLRICHILWRIMAMWNFALRMGKNPIIFHSMALNTLAASVDCIHVKSQYATRLLIP